MSKQMNHKLLIARLPKDDYEELCEFVEEQLTKHEDLLIKLENWAKLLRCSGVNSKTIVLAEIEKKLGEYEINLNENYNVSKESANCYDFQKGK